MPYPPPRLRPHRAGVETRQILLTLGTVCLIAAFTAGTALVWAALRPGGQAALMAAITAALLIGATAARRLPATAEALATVGLAGCVVDAVAARTLHLSFATGLPLHWYATVAALGVAAVAFVVGTASPRLVSAPVVWASAPLLAAVAAVNPTNHYRTALLAPTGIAVAAGLENALRRTPSPNLPARVLNAIGGTVVAAVGFGSALIAAGHHDPMGLWGAAVPIALFALPGLAGNTRWVADDLTAAMSGTSASILVMAFGIHSSADARAVAAIALPILAVYVLALRGGGWTRRTQIVVGTLGVPGLLAWNSLIAVDQRFATVDFVLAAAAAGVAIAWPNARPAAYAVRGTALVVTTMLSTLAASITLHLHDVATIEAYLATPAGLMTVIAAILLYRNRELSSAVLAPGLTLGLLPTLFLALGNDPQRQVILLVAATVIVCVGAELRLGVPLAAGAGILGLLALRLAGPQLAMLPKWEVLAAAGAVLLTLGATWDSRLEDARKLKCAVTPRLQALR